MDVNDLNLLTTLIDTYSGSDTFAEMHDFLSKILVHDPGNRMDASEALKHPWLNCDPYDI